LLHRIRTTEKLLLEQKYPAALLQLIEANGIDDKNIQVRFLHAFALSKTGQLDVAEKMLENILAEHPAYYRANALLAEFRLIKGRVGEAALLMIAELEVNGKQPERQVSLADYCSTRDGRKRPSLIFARPFLWTKGCALL